AIDGVKSNSSEVLDVINDLKKASDEIGQIVSMMPDITEQTSLLALNASIEAARAGEAGKGFAVVADEVKKLAEESKGSAEDITKIVTSIQEKIQKTESSIKEEQSFIDISVDKVSVTAQGFSNILKYIQGISEKISTMTSASVQQNNITSQMAKTIDVLSQGLQDNSAASQEISASVENQVNTFKQIQVNIEDIKNITESLKEQTGRFKL
ncbi:MAG: methyl-accepting chemotaxis protein, partial [Methanobacterium paludis]|nr:methyl-accepting chemotaxis protein [Methanobacterium paludis]